MSDREALEWLPIEGAPKDGCPVLLGRAASRLGHWKAGIGAWVDSEHEVLFADQPTHWHSELTKAIRDLDRRAQPNTQPESEASDTDG